MDKEEAKGLIAKYNAGDCTPEEKAIVESWYLQKGYERDAPRHEQINVAFNKVLSAIDLQSAPVSSDKPTIVRWITAAAAVVLIVSGIYFFSPLQRPDTERSSVRAVVNDIAPGGNRATLTSNGKSIALSDSQTGLAINAAQLTYNDGTTIDPSTLGITGGDSRALEVTTPKGGTYFVILQDGTKVWLNADSKLEFFSNYRNKSQRIVKLTGEAYFEVAKDKKRSFIVQSPGQFVKVLGTHFNVNCYPDEPVMRTTLLEGKVMLEGKLLLRPGEQGQISRNGEVTTKRVDVNEAIAWKNGRFAFNRTNLQTVLTQMGRWYNVDIKYPNGVPDEQFTGNIDRNNTLSQALDILKFMKVNFEVEGRTIIVKK